MLSEEEKKIVKFLRGWIVAMDNEEFTAKIKTWEGVVSFSTKIYLTFNSRSFYELTDSLESCFYDDYDVLIKRVRVGLNKDNELVSVSKLATNDPVYELERLWSLQCRGCLQKEYQFRAKDMSWLIDFFDAWPDNIPHPSLSLMAGGVLKCEWDDDSVGWNLSGKIDIFSKALDVVGTPKSNPGTTINLILQLYNKKDVETLFSLLTGKEES